MGLLRQDIVIGSICAGDIAQLDQSAAFEGDQSRFREKLILRKTIQRGFDESRRLLQQVFAMRCEHACGGRPVVDLDTVVNRLLPFAQCFVARGELGVKLMLRLGTVYREQFFSQEVLKKAVKLVLPVVQMADQRKSLVAQLDHKFFQRVGLQNARERAFVDCSDQRCSTKDLLFLGGSRRIKLFGEGIKRFATGGILAVQIGQPFAQGRAELQQPGRMLFDQLVPIFASQPP